VKRIFNILKGLAFFLLIGYLFITFLFNSIFQKGDETFLDGRKYLLYIFSILLIIYLIYKLYKKIKLKKLDIEYIREIPNYYSVPVIAFLYNKRFNIKSLIMTTILKLHNLNILKISKNEDKITCEPNDLKNIVKLSESEKYILKWLLDEQKEKYSFNQLTQIITIELYSNQLIKEKTLKSVIMICLVIGIFPVLQMLGYIPFDFYEYSTFFLIILGLLIGIIYLFRPTINKEYSKKGIKEHYNVLGFYNFLNDFTLLSKREMEEYSLWKEYLEFAVLFNINKNYELKAELNLLTTKEFLDLLEEMGKQNTRHSLF